MDDSTDLGLEDFDLSSATEEELQQLISLGIIDEQMAESARQMAIQEGLRYQAAPEGRQAGRVYVAANPLEHIGKGLEQYNAQKRIQQLEDDRAGMLEKQTAGRGTYWDLLRGKRSTGLKSLHGAKLKEFPIDIPELPDYGF